MLERRDLGRLVGHAGSLGRRRHLYTLLVDHRVQLLDVTLSRGDLVVGESRFGVTAVLFHRYRKLGQVGPRGARLLENGAQGPPGYGPHQERYHRGDQEAAPVAPPDGAHGQSCRADFGCASSRQLRHRERAAKARGEGNELGGAVEGGGVAKLVRPRPRSAGSAVGVGNVVAKPSAARPTT